MAEYRLISKIKTSSGQIYEHIVYAENRESDEPVHVHVTGADSGIAVAEAVLFLRDNGISARVLLVTNDLEERAIGVLSNRLLDEYLTRENLLLVACFLSLADLSGREDAIADAEREQARAEREWFRLTLGERGEAPLTAEDVRSAFSYIWRSYLFAECTGLDSAALRAFHMLRSEEDPECLLYLTCLLCLWGEYECRLYDTLYRGIKDGRFARFYTEQSAFRILLFGSET